MNDVNTIFYFYPGTKAEYEADWNANKINPRTIVFIASTGEIYKGGIRYGGLTLSEVRTETTTIVNENQFDPSGILGSIATLLGLIDGLNTRISGIMTEKQEELTNIIGDVLSEYVTLKKTYAGLFNESGFINELASYLLRVGNVTTGSAIWSTYDLRINSITTRVTSVEAVLGYLTENKIKQWISDEVTGIDLSTFLTSGDIADLITLDDLKASGVLDGLLTNFSTAFVNLKSKAEGSEAVIGAWDRQTLGGTITDLFGALSIQVNNLESSVTTSLSSTVNDYLRDSALPNYISGYLSTQAGLVLEANLDHSVATLFSQSQYTEAKNAANSYLNTAGFLTETNADSALASIIATRTVSPENQKLYYCDSIDTSETAATFNAASGLSIAVGSYYSATELATICNSTTVIITGTATPFLILGTDSKKYKITKVSAMEGALASSSLYAAIQVGVKNDSSFIDMVADEVNIESKLLNITGETWANILHVNELVVNSIKDADGNSVQVSYLVDKMQENSTYTAEIIDLTTGGFNSYGITGLVIAERTYQATDYEIIAAGHPVVIKIWCRPCYSLVGHIKVTMGSRDISHKYTTYDKDGLQNIVNIRIPSVTGNVVVKVTGCTNVGRMEFGLPDVVNTHGASSNITFTGDVKTNLVYLNTSGSTSVYEIDNPVLWEMENSGTGITVSNGSAESDGISYHHPQITIPANQTAGTYRIKATLESGTSQYFPITVVDDSSINTDKLYVDFNLSYDGGQHSCPVIGDYTECQVIRAVNDTTFDSSTTYSPYVILDASVSNPGYTSSISIDSTLYSGDAVTVYTNYLFATKSACVPVKLAVTIPGIDNGSDKTIEKTHWICVKPPVFGSYNSTEDYYLDIFGKSDRDLQFVSRSQNVVDTPIFTKNVPWDRHSTTETPMIYLCDMTGDLTALDVPTLTVDSSTGNEVPSWLGTVSLLASDNRKYLILNPSSYTAALTEYDNVSGNITVEDQLTPRSGKVVIKSADGSKMTVYVTQSGNLGFYDVLKDKVHNCVSAYYLAPKYYWKTLTWYAESSDSMIRTDLYPDAVLMPASGKLACIANGPQNGYTTQMGDDTTNLTALMEYSTN